MVTLPKNREIEKMDTVKGKIINLEKNFYGTILELDSGLMLQKCDRETISENLKIGDSVSIDLFPGYPFILNEVEYRMASKIEASKIEASKIEADKMPLDEWVDKHLVIATLDI